MRPVVRKIDRALKRLYNLDSQYNAEEFLIKRPFVSLVSRGIRLDRVVGSARLQGALFIKSTPRSREEISLGIYLSEGVRRQLSTFRRWPDTAWSWEQLDAFSVAAEEVSHFLYLLFHATGGRPVSQLELELQGEVDKFLMAYFALSAGRKFDSHRFQALVEQFFYRFHLAENLDEEQKARYLEANNLARRFVVKCAPLLADAHRSDKAFRLLRHFYRASPHDKLSLVAA